MTAKELYDVLGENYSEVFERIGEEAWIMKYLTKFVTTDYMEPLRDNAAAGNWEEAYRGAHSIKGMALNLGLSKLAGSSSMLCNVLRDGAPTVDVSDMVAEVENDYKFVVETVNKNK